jgi:hypothetical protein
MRFRHTHTHHYRRVQSFKNPRLPLFILRLSADITMDPFFCESGWDRGGSVLDSMWLVIRRRPNYADATLPTSPHGVTDQMTNLYIIGSSSNYWDFSDCGTFDQYPHINFGPSMRITDLLINFIMIIKVAHWLNSEMKSV